MNNTPDQDKPLTPYQVADLLHVNPKTVTRWAKEGRLKFMWTPGGHRRYDRAEVESFLKWQRAGDDA